MVILLLLVDIVASSLAPIKTSPNFPLQLGTQMRDANKSAYTILNFRILVAIYTFACAGIS